MSRNTRLIIAPALLILTTLACNLPGGQSNSQPDLAGTITAQAQTHEAMVGTPTQFDTPTAALTGTPSTPEVSVTSVTNCRTGPSTAYDLVFTANPGLTFQVVGKNTAFNYWIINNPTGGTCWLWGQYAVVSGNTNNLPEYPAPPTPTAKFTKTPKPTSTPKSTATPAPPAAPSNISSSRSCEGFIGSDGITPKWSEAVTLAWQDNANNETGYRVYKNNGLASTLPANSTGYQITLRYNQGTGGPLFDNFAIEAFNDAGSSSRLYVDVPRCP